MNRLTVVVTSVNVGACSVQSLPIDSEAGSSVPFGPGRQVAAAGPRRRPILQRVHQRRIVDDVWVVAARSHAGRHEGGARGGSMTAAVAPVGMRMPVLCTPAKLVVCTLPQFTSALKLMLSVTLAVSEPVITPRLTGAIRL